MELTKTEIAILKSASPATGFLPNPQKPICGFLVHTPNHRYTSRCAMKLLQRKGLVNYEIRDNHIGNYLTADGAKELIKLNAED